MCESTAAERPHFVSDDQLIDWYSYHPPVSPAIAEAHERVRADFLTLARTLNDLLPEGADKTYTQRQLRDVAMQANATIACAQRLYDSP